jgi:hypothetical protein
VAATSMTAITIVTVEVLVASCSCLCLPSAAEHRWNDFYMMHTERLEARADLCKTKLPQAIDCDLH